MQSGEGEKAKSVLKGLSIMKTKLGMTRGKFGKNECRPWLYIFDTLKTRAVNSRDRGENRVQNHGKGRKLRKMRMTQNTKDYP